MEDLKGQAVHSLRQGRLRTPPFHLEKRQGEVAQGGAEEEALTPGPSPDIGRGE
jgi:hypothetical protein